MNDRQEILDATVSVLLGERRAPAGIILDTRTPLANGGLQLTSAALVGALIDLEDLFGVELDDAAIAASRLETLGDLVDLISAAGART
jgi:acyl carrier protein